MQNNTSVTMLDTGLIIPNKYQPRKVFDEVSLNTLAESIKQYGIINPILVRKKEDKYEIIAGERRFRAAQKLGLNQVPVIIKNANEQQMAEIALIENIQRQGLSPIEEAKSYEEIMRIGNQTQESLAKKIGKSQSAVANKIRLLSLPQEIQDALANKKISERHARSLITVKDKEKQIKLLNRIMNEKLTVKETEQIINSQEIDEDEIKQAISDIMKSLNIKEEEKEDDNMNNGNFFPNFDNNNAINNNASLNMMNMQSMNQAPVASEPEVVMPTMNAPMPEPVQMPLQTPEVPMAQPMEQMQNTMVTNIDPNMNNNLNGMNGFMVQSENFMQPAMQPIPEPPVSPMMNDAPMFTPQPEVAAVPQMESSAPIIDEPLFNPNVVMPNTQPSMPEPVQMPLPTPEVPLAQPIMETNPQVAQAPMVEEPLMTPSSFEIPVINTEPVLTSTPVSAEQDKLVQLQELLTSNGYTFKTYSNDTDNCIIIELPRN